MSEFRNRVVNPVLVPLAALGVGAVFVFAFSRVLLAVPKYWSVTLAGLLAAEILGIAAIIGAMRKVSSSQRGIVGLVGLLVLVGGGIGWASGTRPIEGHKQSVSILAEGIAFDTNELHVPAGHEFELEFVNNDASIPHNVAIYESEAADVEVFIGETFSGVASKAYAVPAIEAGEYFFMCDVHPIMAGTVIASDEGGEQGSEDSSEDSGDSHSAEDGTSGDH